MTYEYITCKRCKGTGIVNSPIVSSGVPGGCFDCRATGQICTDPLAQALGTAGDWFGISCNMGGTIYKAIRRGGTKEGIEADMQAGTLVTPITEEQARKFFNRYGTETRIKA